MRKANVKDFGGRVKEVLADPSNRHIPRHAAAGQVIDGYLIMHNGLKAVPMPGYYGMVLAANDGAHEPQEEMVFQEVLNRVPAGGAMIEIGAYWAFYSLWFANEVQNARCYMIEPDPENRKVGERNFAANALTGSFFDGEVRPGGFRLDRFMARNEIEFAHIVHADIQGAELCLLRGAREVLDAGRVGYFFISTHSQSLHYACRRILEEHGYLVIASADFDYGTYCYDGVLVARLGKMDGLEPTQIPLRCSAEWPRWDQRNGRTHGEKGG